MNPECNLARATACANQFIHEGRSLSLGIPRYHARGVVAFFTYRSHLHSLQIGEPEPILNVLIPAYRIDAPEDGDWQARGVPKPKDPYNVGERQNPRGTDPKEWVARHERLERSTEVAAVAWWSGFGTVRGDRAKAVKFIRENFVVLAEEGLEPYYRAMAPAWFAWIDGVRLEG